MSNDGALDMALDDVIVTNKPNRRGGRRGPAGGISKRGSGGSRGRNTPYSDLFGQIGRVKKAFIHLGPTGKSTGVADIIYDGPRDAEKALNTYNNIELDQRPMRITYSTSPAVLTAIAQTRLQPRAARGSNTRGARGGRGGRGGGRKSTAQPKKSQEELDAEMDNYMQAPPSEDTAMES
ncbi:unnamed protein product [Umbelopsis sp. WA50703]